MASNERWPIFIGDWKYQSFRIPSDEAAKGVKPGDAVTAVTWAVGKLILEDNVGLDIKDRTLEFAKDKAELTVNLHLEAQEPGEPYKLTGNGGGKPGQLTMGAEYELTGWAEVSDSNDREIVSAHGAVRLVKGSMVEKQPLGTVGFFRLTR